MGDFLRLDAKTPMTEHFVMAGIVGAISTNCETVLTAARHCFPRHDHQTAQRCFRLRFWVDPKVTTENPWPRPFCRGLSHLIYAGFDSHSALLVDLRRRRAFGRFSAAMGAEAMRWQAVIFPVVISLVGAAAGIAELHCACVSREGRGVLLAGPSDAGKSTLSVALARAGFALLSDDRTFLSSREGRITAWGLATPVKLRAEAVAWFGDLPHAAFLPSRAGDRDLRIDLTHATGGERVHACEPRALVFLQRQEGAKFELSPRPRAEAAAQLAEDLMAEPFDIEKRQQRMIADLVQRPCWRLRYGGSPQAVAEEFKRRTW